MNIQRERQRSRREFNQFCATFGLALPIASSLIKPIWAQSSDAIVGEPEADSEIS